MQWMKNDRSLFLSSCNSLVWGVPGWPTVLLPSLSHFGALFGMWFLLIQWVGSSKGGSSGSQISFTTNQAKLALSIWLFHWQELGYGLQRAGWAFPCWGTTVLPIALTLEDGVALVVTQESLPGWVFKGTFFPLCVLIVPRAWLMDFDFFCL